MSAGIFYFTGTGNSLVLARDVAQELGDAKVIAVSKAMREGIDQSFDTVGIVFPVYAWGPPLIVAEFIKKLSNPKAYYFAVADFGGMGCRTLSQVKRLLAANGLALSAGFSLKMPANYIPMYDAMPVEKQKALFEKEKAKAKEIAAAVRAKKTGILENDSPAIGWLLSGIVYTMFSSKTHGGDKEFFVDEKCNGCAVCEKICPVANIKMAGGKPQWLHHCEQCVACLQWCPEKAIQCGGKTASRTRYHHPEVTLQDMTSNR